MCTIKDQSDQQFTHSGKMLDYEQHAALLLSIATGYDYEFASVSAKSARKAYQTELGGSGFDIDSPSAVTEDLDYDVDAPATILLGNMTNRGNSDNYLPSDDYSLLLPEEKDAWKETYS